MFAFPELRARLTRHGAPRQITAGYFDGQHCKIGPERPARLGAVGWPRLFSDDDNDKLTSIVPSYLAMTLCSSWIQQTYDSLAALSCLFEPPLLQPPSTTCN